MRTQLYGEIKFGPSYALLQDYSNEVSSLVLNTQRNKVVRPATYGTPVEEQRAGSRKDQVTINFFSDEADLAGLWGEFMDAILTDAAEIYWSAKWKDGATGLANPKFRGILLLSDLDTGSPVNEWKQQSKTYDARAVEGPITNAGS